MRHRALVVLVATLATLAASGTPGGGGGAVAAVEELQPVIVTLRERADLSRITGRRRERQRVVVMRLQNKATATQRPILLLLRLRKLQGKADDIEPMWVTNAIAVKASASVASELRSLPAVESVSPDATVQGPSGAAAPPEPGVALVRAPALWDLGARGQGIVVASMDSGVDASHPDLAGRWRGGTNSWFDPYGQHPSGPYDASGHGTWTTGVMVAGSAGGTAVGIAPDAKWIAAKIFNDSGTATLSRIHQAFQWLLDPDHDPSTADAPDVVNNSWGFSSPGCNLAFQADLQSLRAAGIVPIFSAGNTGPFASSSVSPANNPEAFAVGATTLSDAIYTSSARGPSACGEPSTTFPEIVAPGVGIRTTDRFGFYTTASGTSLAAPAASGVLALLLSAYPELTVAQQEAALKTGVDLGAAGPDNTFGYARLDALAAYGSIVPPPPPPPDFTLTVAPPSAAVTAGGTATYSVDVGAVAGFDGDVALSLSGLTPEQATWSFTPATISGGQGTADLNVVTSATLAPGSYPLTVSGTSGSLTHDVSATLVVDPPPPAPDFGIAASPASATLTQGGSTVYVVTVSAVGGFAGDVALSATGLPAGATAAYAPASVAGGSGSSQLTLTTSISTPVGSYPLTLTGTSGSTVHTTGVTLVVNAPPDFAIAVTPASIQIQAGQSGTFTATVSALNGFGGTVTFSVAGLPAGAGASFTPASVTGSGTSQLVVTTSASTPAGSHDLTVTGTSGSLSRSAGATLVVQAPSLVTAFPASTTILTGTLRGGTAANLGADDALFFEVNARTGFPAIAAWYGSFTGVSNSVTTLRLTYKGKNSRSCTQTVALYRWTDGAWVQLDSRSVGTTQVLIAGLVPPGTLADYVGGTTGTGEVRARIRCSGGTTAFYASANLLQLVHG